MINLIKSDCTTLITIFAFSESPLLPGLSSNPLADQSHETGKSTSKILETFSASLHSDDDQSTSGWQFDDTQVMPALEKKSPPKRTSSKKNPKRNAKKATKKNPKRDAQKATKKPSKKKAKAAKGKKQAGLTPKAASKKADQLEKQLVKKLRAFKQSLKK